ncbi:hypothetical protein H4S08_002108 [Coemansia sp. RSA 1365]|nr:hypothetical protein H4S08_002108 [Coemansia sp. RSA 1365]
MVSSCTKQVFSAEEIEENREPGTAATQGCMGPLKKQTSSVAEISQRTDSRFTDESSSRSEPFGSRLLTTEQDVFEHNACERKSADKCDINAKNTQLSGLCEDGAQQHSENTLDSAKNLITAENSKFKIMEVGCGAGNAMFPLLEDIDDPRLFVYACDYSRIAVDVVKVSIGWLCMIMLLFYSCTAFVWDLASTELPPNVAPESIEIMLMVFVFSALHPSQWKQAVANAYQLLKPGGILLFRDYGRNDLAQIRFKRSRLLEDNLYIRGDGTRVYFFTNEELAEIFGSLFEIEQNAIDRRLLINRKRELKMYRVWLQAKFRKPIK